MIKFEVGKSYSMKSICDSNCVWTYKVVRRTDKTVWITDGEVNKFRIKEYEGSEFIKPLGTYSMAPTLRAK